MVAFTNRQRLVGQAAEAPRQSCPEAVLRNQAAIGRRMEDDGQAGHGSSLQIIPGDNGDCQVESRGKKYAPSQISAFILRDEGDRRGLSWRAGHAGSHPGSGYFNDSQRQATKDAGRIAEPECCASSTNRPRGARLWHGEEGPAIAV